MNKFLATTALAATTIGFAATAQAAVTDLSFTTVTEDPGNAAGHVSGNIYRFASITTGVDMVVTIDDMSSGAVVNEVVGSKDYFKGAKDNFGLELDRVADEHETWVRLSFKFVETGTDNLTTVSDSILTFADIDSHWRGTDNLQYSDFVEFDPADFDQVLALPGTTHLTTEAAQWLGVAGDRYIGPFDAVDILGTDNDQINISVNVSTHDVSEFTVVWGFSSTDPAERPNARGLLIDGSYELADINVVPEPASAALLGLGGLALLAGARRRR